MKVADGFWLSKQGYNVNYASQAYKVETTEIIYTIYGFESWYDIGRTKP